ncbi:uncharacterized protein EI90DRAFT_3130842 [Cantharellus anzutake]|uniref:uncharacterized protein n=1 Tax=Cantharellus anzutake TaxID=1750568 RepID=UPI0019087CB8|nr:uncharacterized protein EI90DRAFT_3130842 [Cantharellus anzutake]KAF8322760.1 hypothetical protein EI90DRAFT_3130842 [Cantharellus anzutake]
MDKPIARMGTIAQKFQEFKKKMVRRHSTLQNILTPIFSLPPEILRNILSRVFADDNRVLPEDLLLVCSSWKSLILSSPEYRSGPAKSPTLSSLLQAFEATKIQVTLRRPHLSGSSVDAIPLWIASEEFATRVTCLSMQLESQVTQEVHTERHEEVSSPHRTSSLGSNPKVHFFGAGHECPVFGFERRLHGRCHHDDSDCPQLHTFHMHCGTFEPAFPGPDMDMAPVHLPDLREFHVLFHDLLIVAHLLEQIKACEIRTLRIESYDESTSLVKSEVIPMAGWISIANQSLNELGFGQIRTITHFLSLLLRETKPRESSAFLGLRHLVLRTPVTDLNDGDDRNEVSQLRTLVRRLYTRSRGLETLEVTYNFIMKDSAALKQYVGAVHIIAEHD